MRSKDNTQQRVLRVYNVCLLRMVHDDVYKIIKYTVQKTMTGELAQRALDWWAGLVEHLFGLPQRTPEQEKAVVPAAEDHSTRNKVKHVCLAGDKHSKLLELCSSSAGASPQLSEATG